MPDVQNNQGIYYRILAREERDKRINEIKKALKGDLNALKGDLSDATLKVAFSATLLTVIAVSTVMGNFPTNVPYMSADAFRAFGLTASIYELYSMVEAIKRRLKIKKQITDKNAELKAILSEEEMGGHIL